MPNIAEMMGSALTIEQQQVQLGPILSGVDRLERRINDLASALDQLAESITPILGCPALGAATKTPDCDIAASSSIGERIFVAADGVNELLIRVCSLRDRVEL